MKQDKRCLLESDLSAQGSQRLRVGLGGGEEGWKEGGGGVGEKPVNTW